MTTHLGNEMFCSTSAGTPAGEKKKGGGAEKGIHKKTNDFEKIQDSPLGEYMEEVIFLWQWQFRCDIRFSSFPNEKSQSSLVLKLEERN